MASGGNIEAAGSSTENETDQVVEPKVCEMRVNIITIADIDTIKEKFTCELVLTVKWEEPEAISGKKADDIDWEKLWDPRIHFYNALSIDINDVKKRPAKKSGDDGKVPMAQLSIRLKGVFKSTMKLNKFPFDYQDLKIRIMSDLSREKIEFCKDMSQKDSVRTDTFTGGQEWELQEHVKVDALDEKDEKAMPSGPVNKYPLYDIVVNVKRKASYYMWNVALIMVISQVLIISLAFISYFVGSDASEGRMSVTVVLLLTALAFKYSVSQSLPNTSYQTFLDYYVLVCIGCMCMFICWNALAPLVPKEHELLSLCIIGGLTGLINFIFSVIACCKSCNVRHKMRNATRDYNNLCEKIERGQDSSTGSSKTTCMWCGTTCDIPRCPRPKNEIMHHCFYCFKQTNSCSRQESRERSEHSGEEGFTVERQPTQDQGGGPSTPTQRSLQEDQGKGPSTSTQSSRSETKPERSLQEDQGKGPSTSTQSSSHSETMSERIPEEVRVPLLNPDLEDPPRERIPSEKGKCERRRTPTRSISLPETMGEKNLEEVRVLLPNPDLPYQPREGIRSENIVPQGQCEGPSTSPRRMVR